MIRLWFRYKDETPGHEHEIPCPDLETARWVYDAAPECIIWIMVRP